MATPTSSGTLPGTPLPESEWSPDSPVDSPRKKNKANYIPGRPGEFGMQKALRKARRRIDACKEHAERRGWPGEKAEAEAEGENARQALRDLISGSVIPFTQKKLEKLAGRCRGLVQQRNYEKSLADRYAKDAEIEAKAAEKEDRKTTAPQMQAESEARQAAAAQCQKEIEAITVQYNTEADGLTALHEEVGLPINWAPPPLEPASPPSRKKKSAPPATEKGAPFS